MSLCQPSDFLVHVASKSAVGVARQRHVFVNRSSADDPPALAASRASGALPQPLSTSAPSTGVSRPLQLAPFGMVVSDTQSTSASPTAVTRGRGNMAQLQAADDRYRPCSDELPRSPSPAAALQRRRQLQAAAADRELVQRYRSYMALRSKMDKTAAAWISSGQ